MENMVSDEQVTTKVAAELLGFTVQHVRRLVREGHLRGARLGRDWLIEKASINKLVTKRENLELPIDP